MTGGHAMVGDLTITGAYIPDPATPSIAAAYFTVTNSGPADRLLSITTPAFASASVHHYRTVSGGAEEMVPLTRSVVPAHGQLVLAPGHDHVMLMQPRRPVVKGMTEVLVLTFVHAGRVRLTVPVVADTGLPNSASDMSGMHM
jgi:copper(I)-binding protein